MMMYGSSRAMPESKIVTMWGCPERLPIAAHSLSKRTAAASLSSPARTFTATSRWKRGLAGAVHGAVAPAADEDRVRDAVDPEIAVLGRRGVGAARVHDG